MEKGPRSGSALRPIVVFMLLVGMTVATGSPASAAPPKGGLAPPDNPSQAVSPTRDPRKPGNHAAQDAYFYSERLTPSGKISGKARADAFRQAQALPTARTLPVAIGGKGPSETRTTQSPSGWQQLGPAPENSDTTNPTQDFQSGIVSGRATSIVVGPHTGVIYLGTADGGVWKSVNDGASWTPLTDGQPSLAVGSLALDSTDTTDRTLYVGTGETNYVQPPPVSNGDSYFGVGVLKTTNGGTSWTLVGQSVFGGTYTANSLGIGVMVANGPTVWAGTTQGLYRSTDGGGTWSPITVAFGNNTMRVTDLAVSGATVYAVLSQAESGFLATGIYMSTRNGDTNTFSQLSNGLPDGTGWGRAQVAIARSNPQVLYLAISNGVAQGADLLGLYVTVNGGASWAQTAAQPPNYFNGAGNGQGTYDNAIAVDPGNAGLVYLGGVYAVASTDGGASWATIADVYCGTGNPPCHSPIHPDQHAMAFGPSGAPRPLYMANDGGIWKTTNGDAGGGVVWSDLNANLATTQFYAGDTTANYLLTPVVAAGAQDNGTSRGVSLSTSTWNAILGGDGGDVAIDKTNPNRVFATYPQGGMQRTTNANAGMAINWTDISPVGPNGCTGSAFFVAPFTIDPGDANHLVFGGASLCETKNGGTTWYRSNTNLAFARNQFIRSVAIAPTNGAVQYAGTDNGSLYKTVNGSTGAAATWADCDSAALPNATTTAIAVNRTTPGTVYATFDSFGVGHVWMTTDCVTWTNISGNLPDVPVQTIVTYASSPNPALIVGTDVGIFFSTNNGTTWSALQAGLPNVGILQLFTDPALTTLFAATHGRGVWKLAIPSASDPTITAVNPSSGPTTGGTGVTITGTGFQAGAIVRFGDTPGTAVTVTGGTQMTVLTPAHAAGTVDVSIVNPGNGRGATAVQAYTYITVNAAPSPRPGPNLGLPTNVEPPPRPGPNLGQPVNPEPTHR